MKDNIRKTVLFYSKKIVVEEHQNTHPLDFRYQRLQTLLKERTNLKLSRDRNF